MQVFLTIISGVAVYVLGQAILHFVFEPIKQFNEQRTDTSFLLLSHQAAITNASTTNPKIVEDLKEMGAGLIAYMGRVPCYNLLARLQIFGLPSEEAVREAARELNGIAHGTSPGGRESDSPVTNTQGLEKIARLLRIRTAY